jgi:hypothetical protein
MKKLLLSTAILCALGAGNAQADWKDTLNSGLDKAKSIISDTGSSSDTQVEPEYIPRVTEVIVSDNWNGVEKRFGKVISLKEKQDGAPAKSGLIKKGKSDYQEEIDELLEQVFELISDEDLSDYQEQLLANDEAMKEEISELSELKKKYKLTFDKGDKADITEDIVDKESDIAYVAEQRSLIIVAVQERLNDFGTFVTEEQVEALLTKVNVNEILSMTTVFPVISEFANYLGQVSQDTGEDLTAAKKYYGMYVLLLELQLFIQDQYINKLEYTFIPRITELGNQNNKLIKETKALSRKTNSKNLSIYKKNLESQQYSAKVINSYKKQLQSDLKKVKSAKARLKKDYDAAVNTYKTVDIAFNVSGLIKENEKLFDEVMNLQAPELIPFENEKMKDEFSKISAQIRSY